MTVELTVFATVFASVFGIALGVISAVRQNSAVDVGAMMFANLGVSMPIFWLGLLLAYFFALSLAGTPFQLPPSARIMSGTNLPSLIKYWNLDEPQGIPRFVLIFLSNSVLINSLIQGKFDVFLDALRHLILPSVTVGTISLAIIARMTRGAMLDVLTQDFIRVARAKGLQEKAVIMRHAFRNALVPIVTVVGLQFGGLLSGAVLTETAGHWHQTGRCHPLARLPGGTGLHRLHRLHVCGRQSHRRYFVRLSQPAHPSQLRIKNEELKIKNFCAGASLSPQQRFLLIFNF
jgi:peptide/nickel transport system permease protein